MSKLTNLQTSLINKKQLRRANTLVGTPKLKKTWKDKVNSKRKFIQRCIKHQNTLNLREVASFTRSCYRTVKRVHQEMLYEGSVSTYDYNGGKPQEGRVQLIIGLLAGQHFLNEKFDHVYESGTFRQRLGLGIVVHAAMIREAIELLPAK